MKLIRRILRVFGLLLALHPAAFADSPLEPAGSMAQLFNPRLEVLAETVRVSVKNRQAVTKVFLVVKNPADSALSTGFYFPFANTDTLIDFGIPRRSGAPPSVTVDSSPPLAALGAVAETSDSAELPPGGFWLAPGETATVMLVYQTAPGGEENNFRYVFPLKEGFKTDQSIRSFAFLVDVEEKTRIMEVKTENYPIVVRGNGPKRQIYFWQTLFHPKADIGFSYRAAPKKLESGP